MYSSIKSCVKTDESSITEMFSCNKGIRQGDGLSPVLFSLFMNDLPQYFRDDHCPGVMLGSHSLNCLMYADDLLVLSPSPEGLQKSISNGNRTEWSPIRSVIIRVITKSDDRAAGVRFVYHEYDYRPELDDTKSYYQLIIKITISEKRRIAKL